MKRTEQTKKTTTPRHTFVKRMRISIQYKLSSQHPASRNTKESKVIDLECGSDIETLIIKGDTSKYSPIQPARAFTLMLYVITIIRLVM